MNLLRLLMSTFAAAAAWAQQLPINAAAAADFELTGSSGQNCTFLADRDSFLHHDLRARLAVHNSVTTLDKSRESSSLAISTTAALPRRNFIDDLAMAWFLEPPHDQP